MPDLAAGGRAKAADFADRIVGQCTFLNYDKGSALFIQGSPADVIFCVFAGLVKIYCPRSNGTRILMNIAGPGDLIGYACYGATPGTTGTYDLYWIAVHPEHQGEGGGSRLLDEVERRLRDREARLLVVETSSRTDYESTRRFYERREYREFARLSDFYAFDDDRVLGYQRQLAPHFELHLEQRRPGHPLQRP